MMVPPMMVSATITNATATITNATTTIINVTDLCVDKDLILPIFIEK